MVTSNANKQSVSPNAAQSTKMVQVAEAYSYLSDQKEINLDSIPLPLSPPPSKLEQSSNILEQTIIKQKRLARFKNTDLRRKILLKRTFDLVCEIMDHENGFDFEDETETINKKQAAEPISGKRRADEEEEEEEEDDDDSGSDSSDDSSDSSSDDSDSDDDSSSSDSSDESDDDEEEDEESSKHEVDQLIPKPSSESLLKSSLKLTSLVQSQSSPTPALVDSLNEHSNLSQTNSDAHPVVVLSRADSRREHCEEEFSVVIQSDPEDLDFTELNSIDISENYDDNAFNMDQVTYVDEHSSQTQLYELKTFDSGAAVAESSKTALKRKRNSFEETVHQNEHDFFGSSVCCDAATCSRQNDQQLFCTNPSLGSLSDSTCFYNNQPSLSPSSIKPAKRPLDELSDLAAESAAETPKRLKSN